MDLFTSQISLVAFIANFAYRPVSILFNRFVSIFPPCSQEFHTLASAFRLEMGVTQSAQLEALGWMRQRAEHMPLTMLLAIAVKWTGPMMAPCGVDKDGRPIKRGTKLNGRGGGGRLGSRGVGGDDEGREQSSWDDPEVWDEVWLWCNMAMYAWPAYVSEHSCTYIGPSRPMHHEDCQGGSTSRCGSSKSSTQRRSSKANSSGGIIGEKKGTEQEEEPAYLKAWPGGVNLLACLREMLLGEPCYHPASPAAPSAPIAPSIPAASSGDSPTQHLCQMLQFLSLHQSLLQQPFKQNPLLMPKALVCCLRGDVCAVLGGVGGRRVAVTNGKSGKNSGEVSGHVSDVSGNVRGNKSGNVSGRREVR
ncbi:unnamed protein product [Closterium sp. NIES-64]|nr:unnamed protein product [Closterium sp. NIES-64]